ncbi:MAG: undecaprenyl diphosphate synthase family protein [Archaeoglobaceae archaeon]|nr:undecaprenyl diphosphate synthase family protein [Archaeoglobaceae archaeon]MDW7990099.1 undecaprenyl diphosphate synthase family protein [Archaeoglobaceae archaeon]
MLRLLYQFILERKIIRKGVFPMHIVLIYPDLDENFKKFVLWCKKFGISEITICTRSDKLETLGDTRFDGIKLNFVHKSGKEEILNTIRKIAEKVLKGELKLDEIDEKTFESFLTLKSQPDMIVKAGREVPEFMIWQSIYSELFFTDLDLKFMRYVDFLRIIREYQKRERRYGR